MADHADIDHTGLTGVGGSGAFAGARVHHNAAQSIANDTATIVAFNTERFDSDAFHDTASNNSRLTIPSGKAGKYLIVFNGSFAFDSAGYREAELLLNGTTVIAAMREEVLTVGSRLGVSTIYDLAEADYVEVRVKHAAGNALNLESSANFSPEFMLARLGT